MNGPLRDLLPKFATHKWPVYNKAKYLSAIKLGKFKTVPIFEDVKTSSLPLNNKSYYNQIRVAFCNFF